MWRTDLCDHACSTTSRSVAHPAPTAAAGAHPTLKQRRKESSTMAAAASFSGEAMSSTSRLQQGEAGQRRGTRRERSETWLRDARPSRRQQGRRSTERGAGGRAGLPQPGRVP